MIYAINTYDGTSNIVSSSLDTIIFNSITEYNNGIQIFSLTYDVNKQIIWYDAVENHTRNLYSLKLNTNEIIKQKFQYDNRDPFYIDNELTYSSDQSGVYNIYINEKPITNVIGGAFMPHVSKSGKLLYSLYKNGKYNIAFLETIQDSIFKKQKLIVNSSVKHLNSRLFNKGEMKESRPYEEYMPSPFIFPRLMYDYGTVKPGFYFYSGEILNKLSIIGGASINNRLDTDLLLSFEYRKLKPSIYIHLYGVTRHKNNLKYFPEGHGNEDTNGDGIVNSEDDIKTEYDLDILFSLFEADLGITFKFYQQKIWLEYIYQKFRQNLTQSAFSDFLNSPSDGVFPSFGFDYYRGHLIKLKGLFSTRKPEFSGNMLPSNGYQINYELSYEYNQFMYDLDFSGVFITQFEPNNTFRLTVEAQKNMTINKDKKIVASFNSKIGLISNQNIDDFFHFFGGGLPGIKSYTFYDSTLTGSSLWINSLSLRLPLMLEKNIKMLHLNFQNISLGTIFQFGGGFDGNLETWISDQKYKLSSGVELRLSGY